MVVKRWPMVRKRIGHARICGLTALDKANPHKECQEHRADRLGVVKTAYSRLIV